MPRKKSADADIVVPDGKVDPLRVEQWPIEKLVAYGSNPRKNDDVVERMCDAIREFGFRIPIVARSDGEIVDGHLRYKAALKLGITSVPVALADELTDTQVKAFRLLANTSASWAEWDIPLLRLELTSLAKLDFDLKLTGFDDVRLATFMGGNEGESDPDAEIEPVPDPIVRLGDIWTLGNHRIICGDSTDKDTVAALLDGAKPHLMCTDPPYGVEYDPAWRNKALRADGSAIGARAVGVVMNDDRADWRGAWALFPGEVAYVWHGERQILGVGSELVDAGFDLRNLITWGKNQLVIGRGHYHSQHETCWYAVRKGKTGHWNGDRKQTTLWDIAKPSKSETGHGTQKPVECMARPIRNNSKPGDSVYEPFSGSGTTIIAGEMEGRKVYAVELNPAYVQIAVERWQAFTGKSATLDGKTFEQVKKARNKSAKASAAS